jgi:predicted outer membrane repeat protein
MIRTIALLFVAAVAPHAHAGNGVVGPGNCNYAGFSSVLATVDGSGGGTITFNCGTATITFAGYKQVSNAVVIDGGGTITFDGNNTSGFFQSFFSATLVLKRLTLQHGVYTGGVRALENIGTLVLDRVKVINNASTRGPVLSSGTLFVRSSTFSGNSASSATDGDGGAIENSFGDLDVDSSTFNGNTAAHHGGAIYSGSTMTITNSTFNANTGTNGGGAIYQDGNGNSTIAYATIVGNTAPFGAGVYNDGGGNATLTIARSIVSGNTTGNCDGVLQTGGYNLSNGTGCGSVFTGTGDLINQTLNMAALANNGGPTLTMLPQAGNPAIDHIPHASCVQHYDQRGYARTPAILPGSTNCDSGAVEVNGTNDRIFYDDFD